MKTIKQWLESIEDETIRNQALENMDNSRKDVEFDNIVHALHNAFIWSDTLQGHDYWKDITTKELEKIEEFEPLKKSKLSLRKYIIENKDKVAADLEDMRKKSENGDIIKNTIKDLKLEELNSNELELILRYISTKFKELGIQTRAVPTIFPEIITGRVVSPTKGILIDSIELYGSILFNPEKFTLIHTSSKPKTYQDWFFKIKNEEIKATCFYYLGQSNIPLDWEVSDILIAMNSILPCSLFKRYVHTVAKQFGISDEKLNEIFTNDELE